ncbi:alpha/beta fold hydrolase [Arthrobacter sp. USHLN218]|uniref:alpha/beta fold hydrolase n=1 Tax=Arthrobacter sp. USHLN218 TaxID=3081232 RepID=UPI003019E64F
MALWTTISLTESGADEMDKTRQLSVDIGGCELRITTRGKGGQSYVLVPGIGVSPRYFGPLAEALARIGTVHAVELPGFGGAQSPQEQVAIAQFAALVREALARIGVDSAVLIGHSMGAQIVAELAVSCPGLVQALVLLSPSANRHERSGRLQALRLAQDALRESPQLVWIVLSDYFRSGPRWYFRTLQELLRHHLEDVMPIIQVPTLIVRGGRDPIVPREWAAELAAAAPRGRFVEIEGEPHALMFGRPETVAAYCQEVAERAC